MRRTGSKTTDSKRFILSGYAIWMTLLLAVYYAWSALRLEAWGLIGLSGVLAVLAGVWLNRPARTVPWLLLAGALATFAAGQLSFLIAAKLGVMLPFPSFADLLYLSEYPLVAGGLLIFVYWRSPGGDRRGLIDALTLTAGLGLLSWTFLIRPYVTNAELSGLQKSVAIAYPLGDVLMLALLARLLAPGTGRIRCVYYLTLGMIACLVSDSAYGWIELHGVFSNGSVVDLGWALFYGALGAAALHPSMTQLTEPVPRQGVEVSPARLALLMLASLIAPVVLLIAPHSSTGDVSVVAVFSAVLYLLVLTRLWDAAASHRRALDRERVLRQAGQPLMTAADVPQVAVVVKDAIGTLLDGHAQGEAVLGVRIDGTLRTVGRAADPADDQDIEYLAAAWLALGSGTAPVITPVERLPEKVATARPDAEWVLLCPLSLPERPSVDAITGLIAVFSEQRALSDLAATVEILARQVGLTLEGIMLRQEAIRQRNEAYFRAVVQDASDAIVIVADDGTVKYTTPSTVAIFGVVPAAGERLWDLVAAQEREEFARTFVRLREWARFGPRVVETQTVRRDGSRVYIQVRCSDLRAEPNVAGLVFTLRDVTAQHKLEAELKHRAFHDALTGLPNRLLFRERVASAGASADGAGPVAGVLFIDLDDFKVVNDTKGHSVGDELLVAAGARLSALVREQDSAARLGGDEFALLVGSADDSAAVEAIAARIVDAFAEPFQLTAGMVTTTVTVGVATTDDSTDTDELLRHADLALYAAKAAGKRQWRRWQPVLSAGLIRRREIQEALEEAVASSAFRLVYQPIVALGTGQLAGFEALIRWPHPEWGMMNPDQFITLAEETGQIIPIGAWVLGQATADIMRCRQAARQRSQAAGGHGLYIAVNVSARQFADPDFADAVRRVLAVTGLESRSLLLELTESALLRRDERLHSDLAALKGIGVRLAIDDFGTGYSSLSYLRDLPMSVVKMDKSFVDGIADSNQRLALAEGIVQIARTLDLEVVAEGIETEVQRDLLSSMGCHYGQGYLLARPMPADQAVELAATGFTAATLVPEPRH
jgi:diguanylate cyclase (GGDEF)-like protein/PAS domain S-box-containing protein